ncbi:zinc metallopeptidase [Pseudoprevotella muciniphila]|uniref:Zinc metallopeptidase n=1 Tax=Pseudoprevotella muciniphila TaxID=2133944 RepID=A0A5P8E6J7_9BACT|nr:zinc metallopeptidase [Pseudoprevotella muciniphila]QFQ12562.1 zinc metallopeptidase [Pseudoprevotella muciniphila]
MLLYWLIFGGVALMSYLVQANLQKKFKKFSEVPTSSRLTGREVAEKMLRENGIYDVKVTSTPGSLTDHFNPTDKTVNLSESVYNNYSIMAAAVAAHECGHAVQHAKAYGPLRMRTALVPVVSFSSKIVMWVLLGGMLLVEVFPALLLLGIILFAATTLFSFVTLPVEVDASRRATAWLESSATANATELPMAKEALHAAAYTYVAAALGSLATLFYYIMIFLSRRD